MLSEVFLLRVKKSKNQFLSLAERVTNYASTLMFIVSVKHRKSLLSGLHVGKQDIGQCLAVLFCSAVVHTKTLRGGKGYSVKSVFYIAHSESSQHLLAPPVTLASPPSLIPFPWQPIPDTKRKVYSWVGRWKINTVRGRIWR